MKLDQLPWQRLPGTIKADCCVGSEKPTMVTLCPFLLGAYLSPPRIFTLSIRNRFIEQLFT